MADYHALARRIAARYGVDPDVFVRQIAAESGFNPNARSPAGAIGIAQFMPATARSWGVNPLNPRSALAGAARIDRYYLRQYGGDWHKVLAAYNAGPGAVSSGAWRSYPETRSYIQKILGSIRPQPFTGQPLGVGELGQHIPQQRFIHSLRSALGTPYQWGGTSLQNGVDCSGLIWAAARQAGIKGVPRTSQQQFHVGHPVQMNGLRPGDLVFSQWGSEQGAGHVSIYIGNGKIIEAARPGTNVSIKPLSVLQGHILGARRILANPGQTVANVSGFAQQQEGFFNQQRQAAALSLLQSSSQPIRPAAPLVTPQQTIQKFIQAHQPKQPAAPTTPFLPPITPQPADYAAQLDTIHRKLLTA